MTEMEKRKQAVAIAVRLAFVALLISTVPVGMVFCSGISLLSAGDSVSVVSCFSPYLRAAREMKVGRVIVRLMSFQMETQRWEALRIGR
jgi:hypothetical protein